MIYHLKALLLLSLCLIFSCKQATQTEATKELSATSSSIQAPPDWSKDLSIYEVNIRQYTQEGTFKAFEAHLPRLKEMGVGILWLMPIHPVGLEKRKGGMGSYYSVKDYKAVNPDFGTMEDFKSLVEKVHALDMYLILDWVANHTAWDNIWINEHPDWYTKDSSGNMMPPVPDWSDVADLDFDNDEMRSHMQEAMEFWLREANIDGYRCDVAGMVPLDFWQTTIQSLRAIKPVFMLAEWESPDMHKHGFDMTYGWEMHHIMNKIAKGESSTPALYQYFQKEDTTYKRKDYRMYFISNHDENSWNGTVFERMGEPAGKAFAVLSATIESGMPLLYSGQEAGLNKRLAFFEKDQIDWKDHAFGELYKTLFLLKKKHPALWNGAFGEPMKIISNDQVPNVFAFSRSKNKDHVLVILNLSDESTAYKLPPQSKLGSLREVFSSEKIDATKGDQFQLTPWEYNIYVTF